MPTTTKAAALLEAITPAHIEAMAPAARERLAAVCRHVADMAEQRPAPRSGVLADVRRLGVHGE
jgi:hypothetical protein